MVQPADDLVQLAVGHFELAAEPDVGRVPYGADDGARRGPGAEAAGPGFPFAGVEAGPVPILGRLLERVLPGLGLTLAGGGQRAQLRKAAAIGGGRLAAVDLDDFAIVGEQAVGLGLDVGDLGVNRRAEALGLVQFPGVAEQALVAGGQLRAARCLGIPRFSSPRCGRRPPGPARRTRPARPSGRRRRRRTRPGIDMDIDHVAGQLVGPAAGVADQARRIELFDMGGEPLGVELAPAFVEHHPEDDRRMISPSGDHPVEFRSILLVRIGSFCCRRWACPARPAGPACRTSNTSGPARP